MPLICFYPKTEICPHCGSKLNVQKTGTKTVVTMHIGPFLAKEYVLNCPYDGAVFVSEYLRALTPPKCTFGFDVLIHVGKALFARGLNENKIIKELAAQNVLISKREISYLGTKFIIYLALAHQESGERLRSSMTKRGGYILHLDGTCEGDSPFLFTGLDGISELVLANIKIPSEKKDLIVPFLRRIKEQYGEPAALIHDMGKGIIAAVEKVFPDVPDFICHFHFLRDIGKDLFGAEYQTIRNCLKKYGIRTALRNMLRALKQKLKDDLHMVWDLKVSLEKGQIKTACLEYIPAVITSALIHWAFDVSEQSAGYGFPFDHTHLVFYQRLKEVHSVLGQIMNIRLRNNIGDNKPFYKLRRILDEVLRDKKLKDAATLMEEKIKVFDNLRRALRIALPDGKDGLNDDGEQAEMKTIEKKVKEFREQIVGNKSLYGKDGYNKMIAQIDKYWTKLFADPIYVNTPDGLIMIVPQRTNNILERLFRSLKRLGRKKTGTSSLNKLLKLIPPDTPLILNLENEKYVKIILDGCETLEERFSQIDVSLVHEQLKQAQKSAQRISPEMKNIIKQQDLPRKITALFAA